MEGKTIHNYMKIIGNPRGICGLVKETCSRSCVRLGPGHNSDNSR